MNGELFNLPRSRIHGIVDGKKKKTLTTNNLSANGEQA
jgi:hypothetical protein